MLSGPCELLSEENQARSRKGLEPLGQTSPDWSYLLTEAQRSYLARYKELAAAPNDCVLDLTWNPLHRHSKGNLLATLRTGSCRMWSPRAKRWLSASELLACMGFPIDASLARATGVQPDEAVLQGPEFATGNAMHVANLGCVLMTCLLCLDLN